MDPYADIKLSVAEIHEALGDGNAYYFFLEHGRPHHGWRELLVYYIQHRPIPPHVIEMTEMEGWLFV